MIFGLMDVLFCDHESTGHAWVASRPSGYFLTTLVCDNCYTFLDFDTVPSWICPIFMGEKHTGGVLILQWI